MKEVISYEHYCKENGLVFGTQKSQVEYQRYVSECETENRPYYDEIYRQAQEIKNK
ncbi:TPA: hypothetical protein ACPVX7_003547 [Vibrio parahaemolyticus]|nr:hypothetical protein [Vibrio parahaemolyticus]EME0904189.1 hypothetical protein [Vibrio parahaemolyticus]MBE5155604.1 hypothetical protein [Vibrio parahaemolyticus]MBE5164929.1 hypothetical protein [Vibrio parahaemolyticus]MDF4666232.1 hypothetical protein [Vibrio parahaemolyticus]HCE1619954.1 hypothetical protein [Vibrio parahaemolyticus]